jgi:plastocyanin
MRNLLGATGLVVGIGLVSFACGGGTGDSPVTARSDAAPAAAPTDAADGPGVIRGTMTFEGTPPPPRPLPMDSDPRCTPEPGATSETLLVGPGNGLRNVFVYVKEGLGARVYAVPDTPVVLDQQGCRYVPHVFGVQVGQTVRILNSDPTLHNVHAVPKENREFNFGQPAKVPAATRIFDRPEIMVPFRCDVHGWMAAYGGVLAHPYYAVSRADGSFEIKGLPEGTYTVETWHERLGTRTATVTVDGKAGARANFAFKG